MASTDPKEVARTQALCWLIDELLDELLDAEDDLLALVARPEALSRWRRERLAAGAVGGVLPAGGPSTAAGAPWRRRPWP